MLEFFGKFVDQIKKYINQVGGQGDSAPICIPWHTLTIFFLAQFLIFSNFLTREEKKKIL